MTLYDPELVTPPAEPALSLAEAKAHCRVDVTDDDALLTSLCHAATRWAEEYTRRSLVTRALRADYDLWPQGAQCFFLPLPPLVAVSQVSYYDTAGAVQILSSAVYSVHAGTPGLVSLTNGQSWPGAQVRPRAIAIAYTAGYGTATDVPEPIRHALRLLVGHWYAQREGVVVGTVPSQLLFGVHALLSPYRVGVI